MHDETPRLMLSPTESLDIWQLDGCWFARVATDDGDWATGSGSSPESAMSNLAWKLDHVRQKRNPQEKPRFLSDESDAANDIAKELSKNLAEAFRDFVAK